MNQPRKNPNFDTVIREFHRLGIPEQNIVPHENVKTYEQWREEGRTVCKNEIGVRVRIAGRSTSVFHRTQTELN